MKRRYLTAILAFLVVIVQPDDSGKRKIGKLAGKELSVMKTFKSNREAVINYLQ